MPISEIGEVNLNSAASTDVKNKKEKIKKIEKFFNFENLVILNLPRPIVSHNTEINQVNFSVFI